MRENIKKISRLFYLTIMLIVSLLVFILPYTNHSYLGDKVEDLLKEKIKTYGFQSCPVEIKKTDMKAMPYLYIPRCKYVLADEIKINGVILNANRMMKTYDSDTRKKLKIFRDWNKENRTKFVYKIESHYGYKDMAKKYTLLIMWGLFLIFLPLIWLSRNVSISILNGIMGIFKKGWKKL